MKIDFITPTKLSPIDITSMGDSSKRGDETTIGQFDSGLKYAIALLLRNEVNIKISVFEDSEEIEHFTFDTFVEKCELTGKEKELIGVNSKTKYYKTGFAKNLGYNWELWMAFRELYSNMLDEKGHLIEDENVEIDTGTIITLEFDSSNPFYDIYQNKHLYINVDEPLYVLSPTVSVLYNKENYLRIYKQDVLVYYDKNIPSIYAYNIKFGEIDERRILNNIFLIEHSILNSIVHTKNENYLRSIIGADIEFSSEEFLQKSTSYSDCSDLINDIISEINDEYGEVKSYKFIMDMVKKRPDCSIKGKKITSIKDSVYEYTKEIVVESKPEVIDDLESKIKKLYKIDLSIKIKKASLSGGRKVIADKYEKCIIVDEDFDESDTKDMSAFIVEYIDLTMEGNVIENLGKYILNLITYQK